MTKKVQTIFMLGIGGAGMQSLAQLLAAQGQVIVGSDYDFAKLATLPAVSSFKVVPEAKGEELLASADRLIYTDAAPTNHPLRHFARTHHIPEQMLFEATGEFSRSFTTIAVTGTHGKSSTTAFLGHILAVAGFDPTVQVGAAVVGWPLGNARVGRGKYFVVEADEYRLHFLSLRPAHIIITTIDFDHPDFFASLDDVVAAYTKFLQQLAPEGVVVCPVALLEKYPTLPWPAKTIGVPVPQTRLALPMPGAHMQHNAALALTLALHLGIDTERAVQALENFPGLSRRYEVLGSIGSMAVISDYGHHPTEIAATLKAAREWYPGKKILAIIEPHTAKRVQSFLPLFIEALAPHLVDVVIVYPTFYVKGRDDEAEAAASTKQLVGALQASRSNVTAVSNANELTTMLQEQSTTYDLAIAFTAGVLDAELRQIVR